MSDGILLEILAELRKLNAALLVSEPQPRTVNVATGEPVTFVNEPTVTGTPAQPKSRKRRGTDSQGAL